MGRVRRPVHERGEDHGQPPAGQARRSAAHRDRAQGRLPDRRMTVALRHRLTRLAAGPPRRTIRLRLTLIYGVLFLLTRAGLLAITYVLVQNATGGSSSVCEHGPHGSLMCAGFQAGPHQAGSGGQGSTLQSTSRSGSTSVHLSAGQTQAVASKMQALAASQHADVMDQLLFYSGIALAIMAVVSLAPGWPAARRVLPPMPTITAA